MAVVTDDTHFTTSNHISRSSSYLNCQQHLQLITPSSLSHTFFSCPPEKSASLPEAQMSDNATYTAFIWSKQVIRAVLAEQTLLYENAGGEGAVDSQLWRLWHRPQKYTGGWRGKKIKRMIFHLESLVLVYNKMFRIHQTIYFYFRLICGDSPFPFTPPPYITTNLRFIRFQINIS